MARYSVPLRQIVSSICSITVEADNEDEACEKALKADKAKCAWEVEQSEIDVDEYEDVEEQDD